MPANNAAGSQCALLMLVCSPETMACIEIYIYLCTLLDLLSGPVAALQPAALPVPNDNANPRLRLVRLL